MVNLYFRSFFTCALCIGFWSGILMGIFGFYNTNDNIFMLLPFISSACCWFADGVIGVLQSCEIYLDHKNKYLK